MHSPAARSRLLRWLGAALLTLPLFQGACVDIWQAALINGFFRGINPILQQAAENALTAQTGTGFDDAQQTPAP